MDLPTASYWATIGQFVLGVITLVMMLRQATRAQPPDSNHRRKRQFVVVVIGALILVFLGSVVYWTSIIIATSSQGTPPDIVSRSTTWATLFGMMIGMIWSFYLLPYLAQLSTGNQKGRE